MDTNRDTGTEVPPGTVRDHRVPPRGVLPRRVQTWVMAGLALVIVTVIVMTGHQAPSAPPQSLGATLQPAPAPPERIRTFQRELDERRTRDVRSIPPAATEPVGAAAAPPPVDPLAEERRRREYQSLFADNVAFSTRAGDAKRAGASPAPPPPPVPWPSPEDFAALQPSLVPPGAGHGVAATPREGAPAASPPPLNQVRPPLGVPGGQRIPEGTFVETVLLNRLDGTFSGPVVCLVTTPVYSEDRQTVLIPAGARVLGTAAPVQTWGDARLAVSFHRLRLPNGETFSLDAFTGLNQIGDTGLQDTVNRHYLQVFGASVAVGALSGLAQWDARGGTNTGVGNAFRQSAGSSLAASTGRVLDRYLNVLPTITVREGHRIKVYFTNDLRLPAYTDHGAQDGKDGV